VSGDAAALIARARELLPQWQRFSSDGQVASLISRAEAVAAQRDPAEADIRALGGAADAARGAGRRHHRPGRG
jgi:hypothetical protein